jgi:hypothetical protein
MTIPSESRHTPVNEAHHLGCRAWLCDFEKYHVPAWAPRRGETDTAPHGSLDGTPRQPRYGMMTTVVTGIPERRFLGAAVRFWLRGVLSASVRNGQ